MAESGYWKSFWRKQVSRRRLLGGAVLGGGGLAAAALVGCESNSNGGGSGGGGGGGDNFLRFTGFDALVLDTFDPHLTQFGPLYSGHSAVYSKLYKYVSHSEQIMVPDLAEDFPELGGDDPDKPTEFVIKLRQGVKFHDPASLPPDVASQSAIRDAATNFPGLPGRELTAEDVVWSFNRQKNEDSPRFSLFYRSSQYETMEKIEAIDKYTVKITTAKPISPLLHFLADTNAFIIPREVVDEERDTLEFPRSIPQGRMIGTGPFIWGELKGLQEITVFRNPEWFASDDPVDPGVPPGPDERGFEHPSDFFPHDARREFAVPPQGPAGRPYLDGYISKFIVDNATNESLFRGKKIDVAGGSGDPQWVFDIKDEMPELELLREIVSGWVNTRFKVFDDKTGAPCSPWADPRMRKAMSLAANRQQVKDFIWAGEAAITAPVGPAIAKWALPPDELRTIPGFRATKADRDEDLAMAKKLYQEAGSPEIEFTFADLPSYIPDFAPSFLEGLRRSLDANVKKEVLRAYPQIAEGLLKGCDTMIATWGFDNGWIDLDDWVFPYFKSNGPKNSFGVKDPVLDKMLDKQRQEFDEDERKEIGYQIQRYLLGVDPDGSGRPLELKPDTAAFARLDYATLVTAGVSWPYFKNRYTFPWFGNNHWIANQWFDTNDISFAGRA